MTRERILLWAAAIAALGGCLLSLRLLFSLEGNGLQAGIIPTVLIAILLELNVTKQNEETIWRHRLRIAISSALGLLCLFSNVGLARTPLARVVIPWALVTGLAALAWLTISSGRKGNPVARN